VPGTAVLRIEAGLFLANAEPVRARIVAAAAEDGVEVVVLDLEPVSTLDVSAARMLGAVIDDLHRTGVEVRLARGVGPVHDALTTALAEPPTLYPTLGAAVTARGGPGGATADRETTA
jgi:sulfate permease, SulP family